MSLQPPPRLLLVEDDPISRQFLEEALLALPAEVDVAGDIAGALALADQHRHALWLLDAHLPDGDGADCLRALRALRETPALAVTASTSREELDALCRDGFLEVLCKPVSVALLQATVRRLLGQPAPGIREPAPGKLPVWDETRALAAIGGKREALLQLRAMFQAELPTLRAQLQSARAAGDGDGVRAVLHKLKAGCGFVGAARLARAVDALALAPLDAQAAQLFDFAVDDALDWRDDQS
jgi:DNA-binding response OmpR family regulator